jgi:hypothetical protein
MFLVDLKSISGWVIQEVILEYLQGLDEKAEDYLLDCAIDISNKILSVRDGGIYKYQTFGKKNLSRIAFNDERRI